MKKTVISGLFLLSIIPVAKAQITATVTTGTNAVQTLVGSGVIVSNIQTFTSSPNSIGLFNNGLSANIGINSGVFLSTGSIPNTSPILANIPTSFASTANNTPGDADLNTLSSPTFDASILQFDFVPTGDTIKFRFVFASEEYNEYVNASVNDVFGFFLTGPNPFGPAYSTSNIALIPSTTIPISINTVNNGNTFGCASGPCTNCAYYTDNLCQNNNFCYDGYTVVLTAVAPVVPCSTYTIKLAVADVGDGVFDSGVFLEAGSFSSNLVTITSATSFTNGTPGLVDTLLWEGCNSATLDFVRQGDLSGTDTVGFTIGGSATIGTDYNWFNDSVIFAPGQDTIHLVINALDDGPGDGGETIIITINDTICNNPAYSQIVLVIDEVGPITATAGTDSLFCAGAQILFDAQGSGGSGVYTITWSDPGGTNFTDSISFAPTQSGYYLASVYEYCNDSTAFDSIYLEVYPVPNINLPDEMACVSQPFNIGPNGGLPGFNYSWSPGTYLNQTNVYNPLMTPTTPGVFTYILSVDSNGVSCYSDTMLVTINGVGNFNVTPDTADICQGGVVAINATPGFASYLWTTGSTLPGIFANTTGVYTVTAIDNNNCIYTDSALVRVFPAPVLNLSDMSICSGQPLLMGPGSGNPGYNYTWSPGTNLSGTNIYNPVFNGSLPDGAAPVNYTFILVVDSAGVSCSSDTLVVALNSNPQVDLGPDLATVCENAVLTLNGGSGASYMWSTGASTQTIDVSTTGEYEVLITTAEGCSNEDSIYVQQLFLPQFALDTAVICQGDSALLSVNGSAGTGFLWQTGSSDTLIWVSQAGTYWLQVTNSCGTTSDTALVIQKPNLTNVVLPDVLTPNGDGVNDEYLVNELMDAENFRLDIYNRWGRQIFTSTDYNVTWKGEGDGPTVTSGTYFVVLTFLNCYNEERQINGVIAVFP